MRRFGPCLGICLLGVLPFVHALSFDHVYDDHWTLVDNAALDRPAGDLIRAMWKGRVAQLPDASRPAMVLSAWLDRRLWDSASWGTHLTSLVLWLGCIGSVVAFVFAAFRRRRLAFASGLLWAAMPVHAEVVVNASYREDLFATLGVLMASALLLAPAPKPVAWGRAFGIAAFWMLGALGKESALVLLPLLLVLAPMKRAWWWRRERAWTALATVAALYLSWRLGLAVTGDGVARSDVSGWAAVHATARYEVWVVLRSLAPVRAEAAFAPGGDASAVWWLPAALLIGAVVVLRRRHPDVGRAASLLLVGGLLTCPLVGPANERADRYLLIPTIGTAILFAMLLHSLALRFPRERRRKAAVALVGSAAIVLGLLAHRAANVWSDDVTLWTHATEVAPASAKAWDGLAWAHRQAREYDEAEVALTRARELDPSRPATRLSEAYLLLVRGEVEQARLRLDALAREGHGELRGLRRANVCAHRASVAEMPSCLGERWSRQR